ncbi:Protein prenyltransferase alpha subunit repeat-containing protein 1 [Morus notabilis]|uniref:Protein prenyltransferase alpha subunit repeat-containing protein 1 n=1 Tax=Morus notabilis TaxID=981085 RepID=W9RT57_9ROSA|nr:protein prenyltransferase alpha subunit repeat-containing protein 1 [Morus notabilis]EXB93160.1 Protein prenyltransferase alpha subunit repeat-containing protein 1 [Morus notabilis]
MNGQDSPSEEVKALHLLDELERILESDPLIDEVGFIHPSQFVALSEEASSSADYETSSSGVLSNVNACFWNKDHKLGISTVALLPLYRAAKSAFMAAIKQYKALSNSSSHDGIESEVRTHSRALLLLSCDFGTAWHSRKLVALKKHPLSMYMDELHLSALVLSYAPKCENAWSHRRWVIKSIAGRCPTLQEILGKESELVEKIAERSKMNYRAWNHRCWLVPYMSTEQVLHELKKSRNWAGLHVADNSCFHYRRRLMLKLLDDSSDEDNPKIVSSGCTVEILQLLKEELDWNEMLIKLYVGREGLWLHRRFLALVLIKRFLVHHASIDMNNDFGTFMDSELHLLSSCSTVPDSHFEDHESQALFSATYMLWLVKQIPEFHGIGFLKKLRAENLESILNKACSEKSFHWDF